MTTRTKLFLLLTLCCGLSRADVILDGTGNCCYSAFYTYNLYGESFTTSTAYTGVDITVGLVGSAPASGTAYLTTSLGPGTTSSDEIAETAFAPETSSNFSSVTLFSGLQLSAGTYYLTLVAPPTSANMALESEYPADVTTAPGVTFDSNYSASTAAAYGPASATGGFGGNFDSLITGTPVPEPSTFALMLLAGCATLTWVYRRAVRGGRRSYISLLTQRALR